MATARTTSRAYASVAAEAWALMQELWTSEKPKWMAVYAEHELTPPQYFALRNLALNGPQPMGAVATVLGCDPSNVTGIVDRLEARNLVERQASPEDRRRKLLALTPSGEALFREIEARIGVPPPGLAALSAADQRALRDLIQRALGNRD
jgi:DNA-binding MarR family transcriptional regulator